MSDPILSKALTGGQWRKRRHLLIAVECLWLLFVSAPSALAAKPAPGPDAQPYATLKIAPENGRGGPGEDYKALWTYQARGVPVQIVEESGDWRRICDPEGGLAWVRARALDSRRRVMRTAQSDLPMRRAPSFDAKIVAVLAARATAELANCKGGWCRISVDHATGWVRADDVWGAADSAQCR
jgi:SH3-like domain-containing protein